MAEILVAAVWSFIRMLVAYVISLVFAISYGLAAATSPRRERWMIPLIDILQSVPIVTFFPIAVLFFVRLGGGGRFGAELASIFLIFTCQVWNLAFSVYETVKTFPKDLLFLADAFRMDPLTRVRYMYVPAMIPGLVYNSMMSWANGWYFLIVSEIFSVGSEEYRLPGLGTMVVQSLEQGNMVKLVLTLVVLITIVVVMQIFVWNSLSRWAKMFEYSYEPVEIYKPRWVEWLEEVSYKLHLERFFHLIAYIWEVLKKPAVRRVIRWVSYVIGLVVIVGLVRFLVWLFVPIPEGLSLIPAALLATTIRIFIAYLISLSIVILPAYLVARKGGEGVDKLILFVSVLMSIPASAFFPPIIHFINMSIGNMEVGAVFIYITSMIGYLIYNTLLGAVSIPGLLRMLADAFRIRGWLYIRTLFLPSIFPPLITGSITGWGGAWNGSVVAEYVVMSGQVFSVFGIGSFLVRNLTENPKLMMWGAVLMTIYVVVLNRLVWQPLYNLAERRYRRGEW